MSQPAHIDESAQDERRDGDGHRVRRDVATGEVRPEWEMVRVVVGPDGELVPDLAAKLPGRGAWVGADRASVEAALKTRAFSRSFKRKIDVPDDFADRIAELLKRRALGLISMGLKGGRLNLGFDQVRGLSRTEPIAWRVEARDGSADGRSKIRMLAKAVARELETGLPKVCGIFTAEELGQATGRNSVVHIAIPHGPLARSFGEVMDKLAGFMPLVPPEWPDAAHEAPEPGAKTVKAET